MITMLNRHKCARIFLKKFKWHRILFAIVLAVALYMLFSQTRLYGMIMPGEPPGIAASNRINGAAALVTEYSLGEILPWSFPLTILLIGALYLSGSRLPFSKNRFSIFPSSKSDIHVMLEENKVTTSFKDVVCREATKKDCIEIADILKDPKKFAELGYLIPKGILMIGPSGTGKTLLAKALAGEASIPFLSLSASKLNDFSFFVSANCIHHAFKRAREKAPCVVFIDQLDALCVVRKRNGNRTLNNEESEILIRRLVTEMDLLDSKSRVMVIAATSRQIVIDPILLTPGRFGKIVHLDLPTMHERKEIFKNNLAALKIAPDINIDHLVAQTQGLSGADIVRICALANRNASHLNRSKIEKIDFSVAIERAMVSI